MRIKIFTLLILSLILQTLPASAASTLENIPNPKVADSRNYVSNPDGILSASTVQQMNVLLDSLESTTRTEVAVVAVQSIGNENIEMFATELFKKWGVGKAKEDNGLLMLLVMDQRALRFETGYGVEGLLTDALSLRIQEQTMFPHFKSGDYNTGMLAGVQRVVSVLRQENFVEVVKPVQWGVILPIVGAIYLLIIILSFFWMSYAVQKVQKNTALTSNLGRYKALKTQKSGILLVLNILVPAVSLLFIVLMANPLYLLFLIGIPIITIPANLYGRLMMRKLRRQPIPCTECDGKMHILSERKEDAHLKISQQFEEQLQAVDYDVFVCDSCQNEAVFTLDKPSQYTECPKCKTKAFILHDKRVIVAPTFANQGTERHTYKCKFCGYEEHNNTKLPRVSNTAGDIATGAVLGSIISGRGGFGGGGGGFGGGGFGGGLSGGGGATGRW